MYTKVLDVWHGLKQLYFKKQTNRKFQRWNDGTGEMAWNTAFFFEPGLITSTYMATFISNFSSREFDPLLWHLLAPE